MGAFHAAPASVAVAAVAVALIARSIAEGANALSDCRGLPLRVHLAGGLDTPPVLLHVPAEAKNERGCAVAWLPYWELEQPGILEAALSGFDFVLTDSMEVVPFAARDGRVAFLERVEMDRLADPDSVLVGKEHMLSVLLPQRTSRAWENTSTHAIVEQAEQHIPEHTYVDDGSPEVYRQAYEKYRFSLIVDDEANTVSQAFVRAFEFGTVPIFNGNAALSTMMLRTIAPFDTALFSLEFIRSSMQDVNFGMGFLWQQHRMLQDQLAYRYNRPFEERLAAAACTLCRLRAAAVTAAQEPRSFLAQTAGPMGPEFSGGDFDARASGHAVDETVEAAAQKGAPRPSPQAQVSVFVGVYSAKVNFDKRMAVRNTWGRVLSEAYGIQPRFFLGALSPRPTADDLRARREAEDYRDIVALDIEEGYKLNSRKGLLFLEWCAANVEAEFLLKVDDDVYLRPAPVLATLHKRPPFGYVWGYFDYMSPVPRNASDAFYNHEDDYPFPTFPPYPRGLLRALSMDVVRRVAEASHRGSLRMIFGDDPCIGVHLRQVLLDPEAPLPFLAVDDRDSYRTFAMEPSCSPRLWSHATARSWVVHHVTAAQIGCMFSADIEAGYYAALAGGRVALSPEAAAAAALSAQVSTSKPGDAPEVPPLPDVCACLAEGPLAAALAARTDKINASHTFRMWGDPNADLNEDS